MIRPQECYAGARQCMVLSTLTSSFVACGRGAAFSRCWFLSGFYSTALFRGNNCYHFASQGINFSDR